MPKPYSVDLRARVIEEAETGVSRREAAERFGISPSVVVNAQTRDRGQTQRGVTVLRSPQS